MGGDEALQRAAVLAMRDAAALMIFRFDPTEFMRLLDSAPAATESDAATADKGSSDGSDAVQATAIEGGSDE
jgi:hypothetical protein